MCVVVLSCGVRPTRSVSQESDPMARVGEWPDSLRATWYYTEGLRILHDPTIEDKKRAYDYFEQAIGADSSHAPTLYQISMLDFEHINEDELYAKRAEELSRRAYELDTTNTWYLHAYTMALMQNEKINEALPHYVELVRRNPSSPDRYHMLAYVYQRLNMPYSAIEVLDSAEMRAGLYGEMHLHKCYLLAETGQIERTERELVRYRATSPYDTSASLMLASVYTFTGRDSLAAVTLAEVLKTDPTNSDALKGLVEYHSKHGNMTEWLDAATRMVRNPHTSYDTKVAVVEELTSDAKRCKLHFAEFSAMTNSLVAQYPDDFRVAELHALFLMRSGAVGLGVDFVKSFFRAHPTQREALDIITEFEMMLQATDTVRHYCAMYLAAEPNLPEAHKLMASLEQHLNGDNKAALKCLDKALSLTTDSVERSEIIGFKADIYHTEGNSRKVYKLYDKALKYNPDNIYVLNNYAYFLSLDSLDLERAERMAERIVELESGNATYLDTYAWVLYRRGKLPEALKAIKQAVSLDTEGSTEILVHYGDILYASGEKFMARIYWKQALKKGHDAAEIERKLKQP